MKRETWERAPTPDGPWQPTKRIPKYVLRRAARHASDGRPIVVYRYFYRKVARPTAVQQ